MRRSIRRGTRSIERALPVLALGMATALVTNQAVAYLGVRRAAALTARGHAQSLLESFASELGSLDRLPTEDDLTELISRYQDEGLRFAAVRHRDDVVQAGETRFGSAEWPVDRVQEGHGLLRAAMRLSALRFEPVDDESGVQWPLPRRPEWRRRGRPVWPFGVRGPPPRILVEFDPVLARTLEREARTTLALGGVAATLFLALALAFRRVLRHRAELAARTEHERRLAVLGEMSGVLAHEIRNPLASLKGHAQLLLERVPDGSPERANADRVVREAVRLERLTSDLLDFIRSGRLDLRSADPHALVRDAIEAVDASRVVLRLGDVPEEVPLDPERMHQVLVNLLRNAVQVSEGFIDVILGSRAGWLEIEVRDRGPGIATGQRERIFQPFHTTRMMGTGLGLAVARHIVEAHGGEISAGNHPGGGAVFRIRIPEGKR